MAREPLSLAVIERRFLSLVTARGSVGETLDERGQDVGHVEEFAVGDDRASAIERLDVYADMYFLRLRDNLAEDFSVVRAVLGADRFHDLVADYLEACPPRHPSVRFLGDRLPAFLRAPIWDATRQWLADLAALEWARIDVFDRADGPVIGAPALAGVAPSDFAALRFSLIPACQVVDVAWAVEGIWRAVMGSDDDGEPEEVGADPVTVTPPAAGPRGLLVWRDGRRILHRAMDPREREAFAAVAAGAPFGEICERLAGELPEDEAALRAFQALGGWLAAGLVAGVTS